ncbi:hypothetical protein TRICI_005795 [Trichomonascus ciferrii]|uniref:Uncharacterized protein n=1 Tax=Trichomonascus ciferrii TaxID=44093 RepID=A0A642UPJ1_9ASCO|nr:hypothetical protein TRICI_005795 [Trichomonascus ciferrii]
MLFPTFWSREPYWTAVSRAKSAEPAVTVPSETLKDIRARTMSQNHLKTIYHHPILKEYGQADVNEFWLNIRRFIRDPEELLAILGLMNDKALTLKLLNQTLKHRRKLLDTYKEQPLPDSQLTEELRLLYIDETCQYQPAFPHNSPAKILDWEKKLMTSLRLDDSNVWRLDSEKVWAVAEVYCLLTNRNNKISTAKQQSVDYLCINLNRNSIGTLSLDEFLEKMHDIFSVDPYKHDYP